ncbi:hypothetical protein SS50377_27633 [Spironucleus salmonicida]|uniref:Uncharacterized protein n=1 Tax=Spironucleus salmonicida TaxID=348837 RepID=V6LPP4_9EUKA|nr:hypothetical protein SS50377_27633 [Spironucleus salmonicida]|eukprot:EST46590.1 hypothetical protein SS50377_13394 [Spironucleus salmonicida]
MSMYSESNFGSSSLIRKATKVPAKKTLKSPSGLKKSATTKLKSAKSSSVNVLQTDRIEELEDDLQQLQEFTEQLQSELQDKVRGYEQLLTQQKEKTSTIVQQNSRDIKEQKQQIEQKAEEIKHFQDEKSQLMAKLQQQNFDIQSNINLIQNHEKQYMQIEFDFNNLKAQLSETQKKTLVFEQDNVKLSSMLQKCQFTIEQAELSRQNFDKTISDLSYEKAELETTLNKYKVNVSKAKNKITELSEENNYLKESKAKFLSQFQKVKDMCKTSQVNLKEVQEKFANLEHIVSQKDKKIVILSAQVDDNQEKINQMKQQVTQKVQKQYQVKLEELHVQSNQKIQELQEKLDFQVKKMQDENNKSKTSEQQIIDLQSQMQQLQIQYNQKQQEYLSINTQLTEFKVRCATKDTLLEDTQVQIEKLRYHSVFQSNNNESSTSEQKGQILQLKSLYEDLKHKLNQERMKQDDQHLSSSQTVMNTVKELSGQNTLLQDELLTVKKQLQEQTHTQQTGQQLQLQAKQKLEETERQLKYVKTERDQLQFNNQRLKTELNQILDDLQRTQSNYNSLEQTVSKNDEDGSVQFLLKQQKDEMLEMQNQINDYKTQINQSLSQLQLIEKDKVELSSTIEQLENEKDSLKQQINSLNVQIQSFNTQQLDFQNQIQVFNEFKGKHLDCMEKQQQLSQFDHENKILKAQLKEKHNELKELVVSQLQAKEQLQAQKQSQVMVAEQQLNNAPQHTSQLSESQLNMNKQQYLCENNQCPHLQQNELLQNMLTDLQNKYYTLQQDITTSQISQVNSIESTDLARIQQQYEESQADLRKLYEDQMVVLHDQIADLTLEVQDFRQKYPSLEQERDFHQMKNFEHENEIQFLKQQLSDVQNQYNQDLSEQTKYQFANEKFQQQIITLQNDIDHLNEALTDKSQQSQNLQLRITDLQQQLEDHNQVLAKNNQLILEKQHIESSLNLVQSKFSEQENRLLYLAEKEHQIVILEQDSQNLQLDILNFKKINDGLTVEIQDNFAQIQTLQKQIQESDALHAQFQTKLLKLHFLEQENAKMKGMSDQIIALTIKLSALEMEKINQSKYLNVVTEEKLKLQSSNLLLLNLHKSAIQSKLQLNFTTDISALYAQIRVNDTQKSWNLTLQEVKMLIEAKYISNKSMKDFVLKYLNTQIKTDLTTSFHTGEADFFRIEELSNFSDSLKLQIQKAGIDDCEEQFAMLKQIFQLVKLLQNHIFVIKNLAVLLGIPSDFTRDKALLNLDFLTILKDAQNAQNLLYSPHISDYLFVYYYSQAVLQKVKSSWARCEQRVVELLGEGLELVRLEKCAEFGAICSERVLQRGGFLQRTSLYAGDALGRPIELGAYYSVLAFLFLLDGCGQCGTRVCSGMSAILGENDDLEYELFYPAWVGADGEVVAKGKGKVIR